jgi:glycosyltransferase involved in cell wall biosynthesis
VILRIVGNNLKGGARRHCYILNKKLSEIGVLNYTFIPRAPTPDPFSDQELVGLNYFNTISIWSLLIFTFKKRKNISVVHSHLRKANVLALMLCFIFRKKLIVTCHGPSAEVKLTFREKFFIFIDNLVIKKASLVIHISSFSKSKYLFYNKINDSKKHIVIYNGSDDLLPITDVANDEKSINICVVGELTKRKGMERFIADVTYMNNNYILSLPLNISIYGEGEYKESLIRLSKKLLNITLNVQGYSNELDVIYKKINFHLILSIDEGFGRVITEAMSCGIPTICTNSGAFPEIIEHKLTGYILKNDESVMEALTYLNDTNINDALRINCRKKFENSFSSEIFCEKTIKEVLKLCKQ